MKISLNIQPMLHSSKSGIGYYQQEMINALLRLDKNNEYCLQYFDPRGKHTTVAAEYDLPSVSINCCHWFSATLYQLIWSIVPLPYRLFFRNSADITVFFNYYLPPFAKGKKVLMVYDTVIKDCPETMNFRTKTMLKLTLARSIKRADRIITISDFSRQQIIKHYHADPDKISVIPCAANRKRFYPIEDKARICKKTAEKYGIGGEYYLYLGTLEPRKNILKLIEAYALALSEKPDIPLLVIAGGKGWLYDDIFRRTEELGLKDKVIFTGYLSDDDVPVLMNGAAAFCFPSLYEGFGMPPLEAMSCGTPVIVSDTTSLPEVVGECGLQTDPNDAGQISAALLKVLDKEEAERQSIMGLERADQFSWDKNAASLLKLFEELCYEQNTDPADK
ncbi:MAG: glycosyltransferase family 4 protein [Huintestinicola sp.]|uniref:glycosyltransferase family 4 protein n=1 Tax=Huintestinicola sp. TaxID=2981661 RepID=UPI003EFCEE01